MFPRTLWRPQTGRSCIQICCYSNWWSSLVATCASGICNIYSTVGRSISDIYMTEGDTFTSAHNAEVNVPSMSYKEAKDRSTMLYLLYYTTMGVQQTNLLPKNTSWNDATFPQKSITDVCDYLAILKFQWLHNHHSLIYMYIYIYIIVQRLHNYRNLSIARWSDINMWYIYVELWGKWRHFEKCFQSKGLSVAHSPYYMVYIIL